ncbi:hypothetical protein ACQJBY_072696 [Aegilops geniculata]
MVNRLVFCHGGHTHLPTQIVLLCAHAMPMRARALSLPLTLSRPVTSIQSALAILPLSNTPRHTLGVKHTQAYYSSLLCPRQSPPHKRVSEERDTAAARPPSSRMATTALSMKLLVDTKARRVLFAEASKDVVDFLFSLLALPVGTAVKLLGKESMVGCVGSLYGSVEKLDGTYVQPGAAKDALLHPTVLSPAVSSKSSLLGLPAPPPPQAKTFYRCNMRCNCYGGGGVFGSSSQQATCNNCRTYMTEGYATSCPSCNNQMTTPLTVVPPAGSEGPVAETAVGMSGKGFVQGIVTYTVMDDLTVTPMSSISSITLLNTFAVRDLTALQEKTVQLGYDQGLEILKASLQSKTVLTDVFLKPLDSA